MTARRFQIRIDPVFRPLMLVGGATRDNSYVEVNDDRVEVRMGLFFHRSIPRSEIESVGPRDWPLWYGIGWRFALPAVVGLVGSYQGVVELRLDHRERAWALFPYDHLAVSLEEPEAFLEALQS